MTKLINKYSKPLGELPDFKQGFIESNRIEMQKIEELSKLYTTQPIRKRCKNCDATLDYDPQYCFNKLAITYCFCNTCGHCNGAHEDTNEFCEQLYSKDFGERYASVYSSKDKERFTKRVGQIYKPKAAFLEESLEALGEPPLSLSDFGAGGGYFVAAARDAKFKSVRGYEPSRALVDLGNKMMEDTLLINHELDEIHELVLNTEANIVSFIGVLEHLQKPRLILSNIQKNPNIKYVFLSVPLFSPAVVFESVFDHILPRHLVAGHTHLYTEESIKFICDEFCFEINAQWWFGMDAFDLFRDVAFSLKQNPRLFAYWNDVFKPKIDQIQQIFDQNKDCSEVHLLLSKK